MGLFLGSNLVSPAELVGNGSSADIDDITITENLQGKIQTIAVKNQNEASGATNPLKLWEGTEYQWNNGGGSQTWYNWQSGGTLSFTAGTIPSSIYKSVTYGNGLFITIGDSLCAYASDNAISSVFTTSDTPNTSDTVYSAPNTVSALTITSVGTGTITLSDTNTYNYNVGGNQTTTISIGEAYPDWLCFIEGVGIKKGNIVIK